MQKQLLICATFFSIISGLQAQIGINTDNPSAMLDVVGDVKIDNNLFLENIDENLEIRGSNLLIQTTDKRIIRYDTDISKYGPINYAKYVFEEIASYGLMDYDTRISADDYIVTVQGYYFVLNIDKNPEVLLQNPADDTTVEGYQIHAYKDPVTNTWHLKAMANNSRFYNRFDGYAETAIDMELNLIIFRTGFITKMQTPVTVDMGGIPTGTIEPPLGF